MKVIGNKCDVHFELNDIPCDPGTRQKDNGCGGEDDTELVDGREVVFGNTRYCMQVKAPKDNTLITTGST